jgi:hypothetical protein
MKNIAWIVLLCFFSGCFSRSSAMTGETYSTIQLGTPIESLYPEIGHPYAVHDKPNGVQEYEYIERIRNDRSLVSENHYFLTIENGRVTGKRMTVEKQRAFNLIYEYDPNWDSYNSFPSSFPSN